MSAVEQAARLRLAGRWHEALDVLAPLGSEPAALVERAHVLADESLLARNRSRELTETIEELERIAAERDDAVLRAAALARRGLMLHAEFLRDRSAGEPPEELALFEAALELRRTAGDERGAAESLFHVGLVHQVVRGESAASLPYFEESYERAKALGDELLMSHAVRHIAFAHHDAGDLELAQEGYEESLRLREKAGWVPGAAAAQIALASLLRELGRREEALGLAEQARATLVELGADRFLGLVEQELAELRAP